MTTTVAEHHGRNMYVVEQDSFCHSSEEAEKTDQDPNVSQGHTHTISLSCSRFLTTSHLCRRLETKPPSKKQPSGDTLDLT